MEIKNIPMEAETVSTLILGFVTMMIIVTICLILLFIKHKNKSLLWFGAQLIFLSLGFSQVLNVLNNKISFNTPENAMISEETSLNIGLSALYWAISMLCMIIGIWQVMKKGHQKN